MRQARVHVPLVAVCLAVALAGCGKAVSKSEYVQSVAGPLGQVDAALRLVEAAEPEGLADAAAAARPLLLAAADDLDEIDRAKGLSEAHNLLVEGVRELADDIVDVAAESASGDIPALLDAIAALPSLQKLQRAQELFAREEVTLELGQVPLLLPETGVPETGVPETRVPETSS
jgi:hypothetical protein